jgi:hypothetical protein
LEQENFIFLLEKYCWKRVSRLSEDMNGQTPKPIGLARLGLFAPPPIKQFGLNRTNRAEEMFENSTWKKNKNFSTI